MAVFNANDCPIVVIRILMVGTVDGISIFRVEVGRAFLILVVALGDVRMWGFLMLKGR